MINITMNTMPPAFAARLRSSFPNCFFRRFFITPALRINLPSLSANTNMIIAPTHSTTPMKISE